jgi:hypothetical protein
MRPTPIQGAEPEPGCAEASIVSPGGKPLARSAEREVAVAVHREGVRHEGEAHQLEQLAMPALLGNDGSDSGGSSGTSDREACQLKWDANRATAEAPGMDEQTYIDNCLTTASDLKDGTLDGE